MFSQMKLTRQHIYIIFIALLFILLIVIVERKSAKKICKKVVVRVDDEYQNYFVGEDDVLRLVSHVEGGVIGKVQREIDLKKIELKVETNKFVHDAQVYSDIKGDVVVDVYQKRPIARIIYPHGDGAYISQDGIILPLSKKFTSRVLLIYGDYTQNFIGHFFTKKDQGIAMVKLMQYLDKDPFLKAQVAEINIDSKGNMIFYTQIGKQYIQFGQPSDWENKFDKIKMAYKEIIPSKGWAHYQRIDVRFKDQIICE